MVVGCVVQVEHVANMQLKLCNIAAIATGCKDKYTCIATRTAAAAAAAAATAARTTTLKITAQ